MSGGWARACARRCRTCRSTSPRRCCPRSASSSAPAPRRCAPMSGRSSPPTWSGSRARRAAWACRALYVMGSNGGVLEAAEAVAMPAMAVESGPAAGVVAAALVARQTGRGNLLSFDMGGTTAKASLIRNGQYETTPEYEVGGGASGNRWMHGTGHPIRVPVIDLAEVSAGGGSIAWVDRAGALRVGPQERRRRAGPRLLRPRRHRAHRHRLQPAARLSRQGLAAGRRPADRPRRGRSRRSPSASPSRSASMCAPRRPPSSTSSTTPWPRR